MGGWESRASQSVLPLAAVSRLVENLTHTPTGHGVMRRARARACVRACVRVCVRVLFGVCMCEIVRDRERKSQRD